MKKIGLITIHHCPNYGATIQAFALYEYIRSLGYDIKLIDLYRPDFDGYVPSKKYKPVNGTRKISLLRYLFRQTKKKTKEFLLGKPPKISHYNDVSKKKFDEFNSRIAMTKPYMGIDELYNNPPLFDLYLCGSDQVWNPSQPYCIEPYFLTFVKDVKAKKISYGSSIGITDLTKGELRQMKQWLSTFDAISVREKTAKNILDRILDKPVVQVADPTFLMPPEYWMKEAIMPSIKQPYIVYFPLVFNIPQLEFCKRISRESGIQLICLCQRQPTPTDGSYMAVTDAGPLEWLGWLAKADMVITHSFHGTVFSIIMGAKNFFTYIAPNNNRGSRILDLLETFDLKDHLLSPDLSESYASLSSRVFHRDAILPKLTDLREKSQEYLKQNL